MKPEAALSKRGLEHLPECRTITWREVAGRYPDGQELLDIVGDQADTGGVLKCHPDCPRLAVSLERGRQLAEEHGW